MAYDDLFGAEQQKSEPPQTVKRRAYEDLFGNEPSKRPELPGPPPGLIVEPGSPPGMTQRPTPPVPEAALRAQISDPEKDPHYAAQDAELAMLAEARARQDAVLNELAKTGAHVENTPPNSNSRVRPAAQTSQAPQNLPAPAAAAGPDNAIAAEALKLALPPVQQQGLKLNAAEAVQAPADPLATAAAINPVTAAKAQGLPITGEMILPYLQPPDQEKYQANVDLLKRVYNDPRELTASKSFEDWLNKQMQPGAPFAPPDQGGAWEPEELQAMLHDAGVPTQDLFKAMTTPHATVSSSLAYIPHGLKLGAQFAQAGVEMMAKNRSADLLRQAANTDLTIEKAKYMGADEATLTELKQQKANFLAEAGDASGEMKETTDALTAAMQYANKFRPLNPALPLDALMTSAESAAPTAAGMAAYVVGGPAAAVTIGVGAGQLATVAPSYIKGKQQGLSDAAAWNYALIQGTIEGLGETPGILAASGPGKTLLKRLVHTMLIGDPAAEVATQGLQDAVDQAVFGDQTVEGVLRDLEVAYLSAHITGAGHALAAHAYYAFAPTEQQQTEELGRQALARGMAGNLEATSTPEVTAAPYQPVSIGVEDGQVRIEGQPELGTVPTGNAEPGLDSSTIQLDTAAPIAEPLPGTERGTEDRGRGPQYFEEPPLERTGEADGTQPGQVEPTLDFENIDIRELDSRRLDRRLRAAAEARRAAENQAIADLARSDQIPVGQILEVGQPQQATQEPTGRVEPVGAPTLAELLGPEPGGRTEPALATRASILPDLRQEPQLARRAAETLGSIRGAQAPPPGQPPVRTGPAPVATPNTTNESRPDAIRRYVRETFLVPITQGGLGSSKHAGEYKVKPRTIRILDPNDLATLSHELGHHFSESFQEVRTIMAHATPELIRMAQLPYQQRHAAGNMSVRDVREEGFAEFISHWLTQPAAAATRAPTFTPLWQHFLDTHPQQREQFMELRRIISLRSTLSTEDLILQKMGGEKIPVLEGVWEAARTTPKEFVFQVLDRWDPIKRAVDDFAPGIRASKDPYKLFRLLAGDGAMIEDWLTRGTIPYNHTDRLNLDNYGKSLTEILRPIWKARQADKFTAYLISRRASELLAIGKERLLTPNEIAAGLQLETGQFRQVAEEIYKYNDQLLQYRIDAGAITPELAEKFRGYEAYIPFFRFQEESGWFAKLVGGSHTPSGHGVSIKRLTGGRQNLNDIVENLVINTAQTIYASNRNAAVNALARMVEAVPGAGQIAEHVKVPMEAISLSTDQIIEQLEDQGLTVDRSMAQNLAVQQTFFRKSPMADERKHIIVYMRAGEYRALQINDEMVWRSLNTMEPPAIGLLLQPLVMGARLARAGIVLDPRFMVGNFFRDTVSATIQARSGFIPGFSTLKGALQAAEIKLGDITLKQMSDNARYWRALGGASADIWHSDPKDIKELVDRMAKRGGFARKLLGTPARIIEVLEAAGAAVEGGTRISEFTKLLGDPSAATADEAIDAALASRNVSTDFGMHGASPSIRILSRLTMFLNPALQGLYRTGRIVSGAEGRPAQAKAALVGFGITLLSLLLYLRNRDEDWYKELEDWEKNTYWHFDIGLKSPEGKVLPMRIPKPFEYGLFFASIPEATLELQLKRNGKDFRDRVAQGFGMVLGFRVIPTVPNAIMDWAYNRDSFTGRPIIPDKQAHLEPKLQYSGGTSLTSRALGEVTHELGERVGETFPDLGQSLKTAPADTDFLVRNLTGGLGVHALLASDLLLSATGDYPEKPEKVWYQYPVINKLFHDPDNPNSKAITDYYNELERTRRAAQSLKHMDEDAGERYRARHEAEIERAKANEKVSARMAKLRKQRVEIEADMNLSPADKRKALNEVVQQLKETAAQRLEEIEQ